MTRETGCVRFCQVDKLFLVDAVDFLITFATPAINYHAYDRKRPVNGRLNCTIIKCKQCLLSTGL